LARRDDNRTEQMLIVLGAVLIDIERPISWLLAGTEFYWLELGSAFHSILGAIVLSYFATACFTIEDTTFKNKFLLILLGCSSHLLLDLVMYPWVEIGLYLLYPIKVSFSLNLLWPDYSFYPVFGMIIIVVVYLYRLLFSSCYRTKKATLLPSFITNKKSASSKLV
ncbi:MAG: metal-dependent hydrolase, partial [Candidatus Thorarchaeota archaeon]